MGQAKLRDVSFNLVARRGLQTVLGYPSFCTTTDMLMRTREATRVSFDLFSALVFSPASVSAVLPALESIRQITGIETKIYHDVDRLLIIFSDCTTNVDGHDGRICSKARPLL
jgi:hypothetical protein